MSIIAPRPTLGWKLLPAVLAATISVSLAGLALESIKQGSGGADLESPTQPAVPDLSHAPWRTDLFPVGASGPLNKDQLKRFGTVRDSLRPVVRNVADALAFSSGDLKPWVTNLLTPEALKAMKKLRLQLPQGVMEIEAVSRRARIGIQAPSFRAAAARVRIQSQGTLSRRIVSWQDMLTLWFERGKQGAWRLIAFDLERERDR